MPTKDELEKRLIASQQQTQSLRDLLARSFQTFETLEILLEQFKNVPEGHTLTQEEAMALRQAFTTNDIAIHAAHTWRLLNKG